MGRKWILIFGFFILFPFLVRAQNENYSLPKIIISEVYINPNSRCNILGRCEATSTNEWMNEWVELRNMSDSPIDISGWKIKDNTATTIIPFSFPIPPGGFAIITPSTSTFEFWPEISEGTIKIVLGEKIGNGLANGNDYLILEDQNGEIIDSVCWGSENYCTSNKFNYACPSLLYLPGYSLEKKPLYLKPKSWFCSFFVQERPNPGKSDLENYWHREIGDLEDAISGYEILSAQLVYGDEKILRFLPFSLPTLCKTLITKLELREILSKEGYTFFLQDGEEFEGYGGAAMGIEAGNKIYLLAFDLSHSNPPDQYLFVSENEGKSWSLVATSTDYYFVFEFENDIYFALNTEKFPPLPWKIKFLSGFVFADFSDYRIFDETSAISLSEFENQPPIPIINFSPRNPVKGIEVKFDASLSTDPDGQIVNFEWQIASTTLFGTTTTFTFAENGDYEITLIATDNDGATSSTSTILKVGPFSFAIITDLHIGRGYPDYDSSGFDDSDDGEDYYLTERLKNVVQWIIDNRNNIQCENATCSIKFLAVLGDIADSAEKSEFLKAKKILDRLNDYGIPYVPVFGNHDVWPYTDEDEATSTLGGKYFSEIFWCESEQFGKELENKEECLKQNSNLKLIKEVFGDSFKRDEIHKYYKDFAFGFGGINFIVLDFNTREPALGSAKGVGSDAVLTFENEGWLESRVEEYKNQPIIIFSHHPLINDFISAFESNEIDKIKEIIKNENVFINFAGHIHGFYPRPLIGGDYFMNANKEYSSLSTASVITTEALMVGSNEENPKGIIRIVKVLDKNQIDYNNWETTQKEEIRKEFIALNPYMVSDYKSLSKEPCMVFKGHAYTKREHFLSWEINGSSIGSGEKVEYCFTEVPKIYEVKLTAIDKEKPDVKESIIQKIKVISGLIPKFIKGVKEGIEVISTTFGEKLTEFGRTIKDTALIRVRHSEPTPVGLIAIDFEKAIEDIDLSNLVADTNTSTKKSILYMPEWPKEIEKEKVLFISK